MNDLEERLRSDLQHAAAGVADEVDVEQTLLAGQRARSSRRIAGTVGVSAVATVIGLVGWAALRFAPVLGGVPDPMGTVSAVPSTPVTPSDPMSTTFEISGAGIDDQLPEYDSIRVAVRPSSTAIAVDVSLFKGDSAQTQATFEMEPGKVWYAPLGKHLVVGIVPDRVAWLANLDESSKGVSSDTQPIEGLGASAFWLNYEQVNGSDSIRGLIWQRADGVIRDSLGRDVPNALISLNDQDYLVYRDLGLDTVGIVPSKDGGRYSTRISDTAPNSLIYGGLGTKAGSGTWNWTQYGFLPPGSHDILVEMSTTGGDWGWGTLDDGWVAFVAHATTRSTDVIKSVTYTNADGKVVTYRR